MTSLEELERIIDAAIDELRRLREENASLRRELEEAREREREVRERIEKLIEKLKQIEG